MIEDFFLIFAPLLGLGIMLAQFARKYKTLCIQQKQNTRLDDIVETT